MNSRIFINGRIYTMNRDMPFAEAVVIKNNKIAYVGRNEAALAYKNYESQVIDLKGKMMLPGFIDAHCHPVLGAFRRSGLILNADMNKTDVLEAIKTYISANPDRKSYFGIGYPEWIYDKEGSDKSCLDEICNDKPIFIMGSKGHEGWCNSKTLDILGINENTPDPIPGFQYFQRYDNGKPTGHIVGNDAIKMLMNGINWFDTKAVLNALEEVSSEYSKMGVTALADCGTSENLEKLSKSYLSNLEIAGALKQRVCSSVRVEDRNKLDTAVDLLERLSRQYCSDEFYINTLEIINDGTAANRDVGLFEAYDKNSPKIEPMIQGKELQDLCIDVAGRGFDLHIHAAGYKSSYETLLAAKAVREAGFHDTRITNTHTDYVKTKYIPMFNKYNVIANTTPVWHYSTPKIKNTTCKCTDEHFKMLSIVKECARISLGSDMPNDEYGAEPLKGIQMGITRQLYNNPDSPVLEPESEKLSIMLCLEGYTINAAYQMHMEHKIGSIEAGKYADLVVLKRIFLKSPFLKFIKPR